MKIAVIHPTFIECGGAERKALLIAQGAKKAGHDITIFTFEKDEERSFKEFMMGLRFVVLPYGNGLLSKIGGLFRMANQLKGFDVIHAHNFPANIVAAIAKKKFGTPVLYYCNEPFLYEKGAIRTVNPVVLFIERIVERWLMRDINLIIANSRFTADKTSAVFRRPVEFAYSGIHTDRLVPVVKSSRDEPIVLSVNRFTPEKRIETLLPIMMRVWEIYPKARLWIAGNGEHAQELQRRMKDPRITFFVGLPYDELIKLYQQAHVFVFPAHNEPLGVTPIEAMCCATPVVAHASGGPKESLLDDKTGFLVTDDDGFVKRIKLLISMSQKRYDAMGLAARKHVLATFTLDSMVENALKFYDRLFRRRKMR